MTDRFDDTPHIALKEKKSRLRVLPENPDPLAKGHFPSWLRKEMPKGEGLFTTDDVVKKHRLHTVCEEAKCPNRVECFSKHTATFLAMGSECTRACGFCEIGFSKSPALPDSEEPENIASSVEKLGLKHAVITMVARDDLTDGGAEHLCKIIRAIRSRTNATIEVLTSDFSGNFDALDLVLSENVEIFNYNLETVKRLTPKVRHKATYERTLAILERAKASNKCKFIKSGLMLGFSESDDEVFQAIEDLHCAGVDIITMGQYLQPSKRKLLVKKFISPESYQRYESFGKKIGVRYLYAGPFVRSSYNAKAILETLTT